MSAIAYGCIQLNEISQKTLSNNTAKTCVYLKILIELGVIEKEFSIDTNQKEKTSSSKGIYRLTDNYFKFWYSFIYPNFSELEFGNVDGVLSH